MITAAGVATLGGGAALVGSSARGAAVGGQGPPTGTLVFDFEAGPTMGFNSAHGSKAGAPRPGDVLTVRGPISRDGKRIGVAVGTLTFQGGTPTFMVVYRFDRGDQLVVAGQTTEKPPTAAAVVGGTGAYAGARGESIETLKDAKKQLYQESVRFIP